MDILTFIEELRNTDGYIRYIYTEGGCYRFHLLLKKMYKGCTPYISKEKNHIVSRYKGRFYDIDGEVKSIEGFTKLSPQENTCSTDLYPIWKIMVFTLTPI